MLDERVIKVLEYLQPFGFTSIVNIAPIVDKIFAYNPDDTQFDFNINQRNIKYFLRGLCNTDLIAIPDTDSLYYKITTFSNRNSSNTWYVDGLEGSITKNGLKELSDYKNSKMAEAAHQSAIEVNTSILQTNQSVRDTNQIVTSISKTQKNIAYISLGFIAISTIYLVATYYKDDSPSLKSISKQLQQQGRLLDSMRKSQKGIDSSLKTMAKKTLPKKKHA